MENKICPKRIGQAPTHMVVDKDGNIDIDYRCFGESCAWYLKHESGDLKYSECAIMSLVSIQDLVR